MSPFWIDASAAGLFGATDRTKRPPRNFGETFDDVLRRHRLDLHADRSPDLVGRVGHGAGEGLHFERQFLLLPASHDDHLRLLAGADVEQAAFDVQRVRHDHARRP